MALKMKSRSPSPSMMSNPLMVIVYLLLGLIIVLAIFRPATPFLNLGFGFNAHIGELRSSFEFEAFTNETDPAFVMYYADWCGHCKKAKPHFQKLMDSNKSNVKVMMINCEDKANAELVKSQNIKGFPTIRYYSKGLNEKFEEYDGERSFDAMLNYVNKVSGNPGRMPDNAAPFM